MKELIGVDLKIAAVVVQILYITAPEALIGFLTDRNLLARTQSGGDPDVSFSGGRETHGRPALHPGRPRRHGLA